MPIQNPEIVAKINQTYRVNFLKDVALARLLDEQTFSALTSIAFLNQAEIVTFIQSDPKFLDQLFSILSEEKLSLKRRKDVVLFLHELSSIVKGMHPHGKSEFFRSLAQHGLFAIFEYTLGDHDTDIRIAVISILTNILDGESSLVRSFCLAQSKQGQKTLSEFLVDKFLTEPDSGLRSQLSDILRMLLDTFKLDATEGLVHQSSEAEEFLTLFYESALSKLVSPILELDKGLLTDEQGNFIKSFAGV